jgi:SagB-type dehydrogenase family enzyme
VAGLERRGEIATDGPSGGPGCEPTLSSMDTITQTRFLPAPRTDSAMSLEAALARRRTIRELRPDSLTDAEIGQLLWAAQGVTREDGRRTVPSASSTFPLEVYAATPEGLARYLPGDHALELRRTEDVRIALQAASGDQPFVGSAPLILLICAVAGRVEPRHGRERATRYAAFEAGHAGQAVLLQAVALDLAAVPVGSFDDAAVAVIAGLAEGEAPLYLFVIGRPA